MRRTLAQIAAAMILCFWHGIVPEAAYSAPARLMKFGATVWYTDFYAALKEAQKHNKWVLVLLTAKW